MGGVVKQEVYITESRCIVLQFYQDSATQELPWKVQEVRVVEENQKLQ